MKLGLKKIQETIFSSNIILHKNVYPKDSKPMKGRFLFLSSGSRLSIMMQFSALQRGNLVSGDGATYTQPLSVKTLVRALKVINLCENKLLFVVYIF